MAMARCRECNKRISTEAETCPNCGAGDPYDPPEPVSAESKVLQALFGVGVMAILFVWCSHMGKDTGDVQAEKPKPKIPLAEKITNMPEVCKLLIETTIIRTFRGKVLRWGKSGAWRKGNYNYASHRATFTDRSGGLEHGQTQRFKILCCIDRRTEQFGIWSITDLRKKQTQAVRGEGSCRN